MFIFFGNFQHGIAFFFRTGTHWAFLVTFKNIIEPPKADTPESRVAEFNIKYLKVMQNFSAVCGF